LYIKKPHMLNMWQKRISHIGNLCGFIYRIYEKLYKQTSQHRYNPEFSCKVGFVSMPIIILYIIE